jgi:hypothetical protein
MDTEQRNYVIILFNGYMGSKIWWDYAEEGKPVLRKLDFLDKLKKIGKTYTFNLPFCNVNYYYTKNNKKDQILWKKIDEVYKPYSSNINFKLEDLDYKNICEKTYNSVKKKYGNNKKYIIIAHSWGGIIGLLFSKLYKNDCILCCCIDNVPNVLSHFNKHKCSNKEKNSIYEKYSNNEKLKKSLNIIKNSKDNKEKNKEIDDIYTLLHCKSGQDRINYYDKKLYVPTIFFRAYSKRNEMNWNISAMKEKKLLEKDSCVSRNLKQYIIMDANHFIWENQEFSDKIIDTIKKQLSGTL